MAELSPFLNSNPKDRAFALGTTGNNITIGTGNWYEIELLVNGGIVASSGRLREESLKNFEHTHRFYRRPKDRVRVRLRATKHVRSYPYSAMFRVNAYIPPPSRNGQVVMTLSGSMVQSSSAMRKARAWSATIAKQYRSATPKVKRSTALRPTPVLLYRPFLSVNEFDNGSYSYTPTIESVAVYYRAWSGSRTPGWGSKKPRSYVDNNHEVVLVDVQENRYSWYQVRPANGTYQLIIRPFTSLLAVPSVPYLHVAEADSKALSRLISNAQVGIQANLAQNIAQVSQLASLITTNVGIMTSSLRQLRRGNIPGAVAAFKAGPDPRWRGSKGSPSVKKSLANNWLQLQYGWKPLLSDIEGFIKVMGNQMNGTTDFVQKVRASGSVNRQVVSALPNTSGLHGSNNGKTTFTYRTTTKYVIRYRMDSPLTALFSQTGFTNPINLFWELIPFSFVVDWFVPIGNYLEALNAWQGMTFLGGSYTRFTRLKTDSTVAYSGPHPADSLVNVLNFARYRDEQIFLNRQALSSFPSPRIPTLRNGIAAGNRAANAIALLTKAFK